MQINFFQAFTKYQEQKGMKMNINFLSNSFKSNSIQQSNFINVTRPTYKNSLASDVFVKSTKNVSFGSIDKPKYASLKEDMTQYFMNAEELSVEEIGSLVKKHLPETNFDDIKNVPKQSNVTKSSGAYTYEPTQFYISESGCIQVTSLPKTIYLNFNTPTKDPKEARVILLDRLLHEMTHVLQDEEDSDTRKENLFNKYLGVQKNQQKAMASFQAVNAIYNTTEQTMMNAFVSCLPTAGSLPKEVNRRIDVDSLFMKKTKMSASTHIRNILSKSVNVANMQFGGIDKDFALDFVILKSKNEKEAYQNALDSNKELLGINSKTDFDLRIEMYQKFIDVAESMKS